MTMKIKTVKIHIYSDSEYQTFKTCCEFLDKCKIDFNSYSALDEEHNRVWCIELESL